MDIDAAGINLLKLIEVINLDPAPIKSIFEQKIDGIPEITVLDSVGNGFIESSVDAWDRRVSLHWNEGNVSTGYNENGFKEVKRVAESFLENDYYAEYADNEFIEDEIFNWAINIYKTNKIEFNLTTYLEKSIDKELREYTFYFKLAPLGLEAPFILGPLKFYFFSEFMLKMEYDTADPNTRGQWEEYKLPFIDSLNKVVAEITVKATKTKAEILAKQETSLVVNALKCFLTNESLRSSCRLFDLDYVRNNIQSATYLIKDNVDYRYKITRQNIGGIIPIELTKTTLNRFEKEGIGTMHNFLLNKKQTEFYFLLLEGIDQWGSVVSTRNLHEKAVSIVTFFEIFLNPETHKKAKAQTWLKNNVLQLFVSLEDTERYKIIINRLYEIRDKYLHNRKLLSIEVKDMFIAQRLGFKFLMKLIELDDKVSTKNELYSYFNIPY